VLFVHARSPFSPHELIDIVRELPLDVERLMYAEGGRQAQLYVQGDDREYEFTGGPELEAEGDGTGGFGWPLPNVLGVARKSTRTP
jgi:hypothetical protein